jgi:hypothetical protein
MKGGEREREREREKDVKGVRNLAQMKQRKKQRILKIEMKYCAQNDEEKS